jgi:hypothetical protein
MPSSRRAESRQKARFHHASQSKTSWNVRVQEFLILVSMFLLVAVPAAVIWLRSGGKWSLASSFHLAGHGTVRDRRPAPGAGIVDP